MENQIPLYKSLNTKYKRFRPAYKKKQFLDKCNSISDNVVGVECFTSGDMPDGEYVELRNLSNGFKKAKISRIYDEMVGNHVFGFLKVRYENESTLDCRYNSGDLVWMQKTGEEKIMLK